MSCRRPFFLPGRALSGGPAGTTTGSRGRLIALVLLAQLLVLVVRAVLQRQLENRGVLPVEAQLWSYVIVPPLLALLLMPVLWRQAGAVRAGFSLPRLTAGCLILGILVGTLLRFAWWAALVAAVAFGWVRNDAPGAIAGPTAAFACPPVGFVVLHLVCMCGLVAVTEEIVNRGFLLRWLQAHGRAIAVLGSALLFAAFHRPDAMPSAFVIGVYLGVLYLNTGTLWCPVFAHATFNGLVVLDWYCLRFNWNPPVTTPVLAALGSFALTALALSLALAGLCASGRIASDLAGNPPAGLRAR